jgi:hypothetical protein
MVNVAMRAAERWRSERGSYDRVKVIALVSEGTIPPDIAVSEISEKAP